MHGDCDLPTGTTGLALNVTAVDASTLTFLTFWPNGAPQPTTANLNPAPGQPPTPNAVNVGLSAAGKFSVYNLAGTVGVFIDVVGVYDDHNHDDTYYTKTESDAAVAAAKSVAAHAATDGSLTLTLNSPKVAQSVSLVATADGTVIVNANGYASDTSAGPTGVRCSISTDTSIDFDFLLYANGEFSGQTRQLAGSRGFDVAAEDMFTANLNCDVNSGAGNIQDRSMTAIFVPD